jgi:predicted secreted protein
MDAPEIKNKNMNKETLAGTNSDNGTSASVEANPMLSAAGQTVVSELISYFQQQLRLQRESKFKYTGEEAFVDAIDICKNAFATKEKQQIKDAFNHGYREGFSDGNSWYENEKDVSEYEDAENYYKSTYSNGSVGSR